MAIGQELLNVPMGDMIRQMALAIAEGQWELDKSSMTVSELMSGQRLLRDIDTGQLLDENGRFILPDDDPDARPTDGTATPDQINVSPLKKPQIIDSRVYFGYRYERVYDDQGVATGEMKRVPNMVSMMELGFTPAFYQFVDTIIEVKISISISSTANYSSNYNSSTTSESKYSSKNNRHWWYSSSSSYSSSRVSTSQVNANYSNKYSYSAEGSSLLRTKLVPVPPPAILEDRVRELMLLERAYVQYMTAVELIQSSTLLESEKTEKVKEALQNYEETTSKLN
jgi:hypothetical protein